jgi:dGTPase
VKKDDFDSHRNALLKTLHGDDYEAILHEMRDNKECAEADDLLAPYATKSSSTIGRIIEEEFKLDNRTDFARDRDRIIHSKSFFRLGGKTQVFLNPNNPLVSTRMTHTIHVAQVSRTLARAMRLNEDLVEAIALGHDLGHSPFGHPGEEILTEKLAQIGMPPFKHNAHSLRVIDLLEKQGKGLNLTWEVREGVLCHDGESDSKDMTPDRERDWLDLHTLKNSELKSNPSTPEACLVRLCDRIAYVGKDIEDGIEVGFFKREDIPLQFTKVLGNTNKMIMDTVVKDIILNFRKFIKNYKAEHGGKEPGPNEFKIVLSDDIRNATNGLIKEFNYPNIYLSKENTRYREQTTTILSSLFDRFYKELTNARVLDKTQSLYKFDVESDASESEILFKAYWEAFLGMSLGEIEEKLKGCQSSSSPDFSMLPENQRVEVASIHGNMEEGEFLAAVKLAVRDAKLKILGDNIRAEGDSFTTIFYNIKAMNNTYLGETSSGEMARDYIASLTDRDAIKIFEKLNIPKSVV